MKSKNVFASIALIVVLAFSSLLVCACEDDANGEPDVHDSTKWFTRAELSAVGLSDLAAPINLSGKMKTDDSWFNDGYSFSQSCGSEDLFVQNAETYLNYFVTRYNGYFGFVSTKHGAKYGDNEAWYALAQSNTLSDYFDDNPCKLYKFYYVTNRQTDDEGYFVGGSVYSFEIRYDLDTSANQYMFKLYIEKADKSHNGRYSYHYKMV